MGSTISQKEIITDYPYEEGMIAETTKQTGKKYLHPQGISGTKTIVPSKDRVGIGD